MIPQRNQDETMSLVPLYCAVFSGIKALLVSVICPLCHKVSMVPILLHFKSQRLTDLISNAVLYFDLLFVLLEMFLFAFGTPKIMCPHVLPKQQFAPPFINMDIF